MSKTKKSTGPKPEQIKIPGTERRDRIAEIDDKADQYREMRDNRMAMQVDEAQLKEELLDLMKKHRRERYVYEDKWGDLEEVFLEAEDVTVKVRRLKKKGDDA